MNKLYGGYLPDNFEFNCTELTEIRNLLNKINFFDKKNILDFILDLSFKDIIPNEKISDFYLFLKLSTKIYNYNDDQVINEICVDSKLFDKPQLKNIKSEFTKYKKSIFEEFYLKNKEELTIIKKNINPFTNINIPHYNLYYNVEEYFFLLHSDDKSTNNFIINNKYEINEYVDVIEPRNIINYDIKPFLLYDKNPFLFLSGRSNHILSESNNIDILFCNKHLSQNKTSLYNIYLYTKFYIKKDIKYLKIYKFLNELFILIGSELISKKYLTNILNLYIYSGHINFIKEIIKNRNNDDTMREITEYTSIKKDEYYIKKNLVDEINIKKRISKKAEIDAQTAEKKAESDADAKRSKANDLNAELKAKETELATIKLETNDVDTEYIIRINNNEYANDIDIFENKFPDKKININKLLINKYMHFFIDDKELTITKFIETVKIIIDDDIKIKDDIDIILSTHYRLLFIIQQISKKLNRYNNYFRENPDVAFDLVYSYNYYDLIFSFEEFKINIESKGTFNINKINNIINREIRTVDIIIILETSYLLSIIYEIDIVYQEKFTLINDIITIYITDVINKGQNLIPINKNYILYPKFVGISGYYKNDTYNEEFFSYILKNNKMLIPFNRYLQNPDKKIYKNSEAERPDCGETFILNLINYLIFDNDKLIFNTDWLPENTIKPIKDFYNKYKTFSNIMTPKVRIEFNALLQNIEFTYQYFDTYSNGISYNSVYRSINIDRNPLFNDVDEAFDYKVYDIEGNPIKKIIKYKGWEIEPGYPNIIRIFNYIFGYNNISNNYNEEKIMKLVTGNSFKEILETFKNPKITEILGDYSIMVKGNDSKDVNKSLFSDDHLVIKFNNDDVKITLYYKHAEIKFASSKSLDPEIIIKRYNIHNIINFPDFPKNQSIIEYKIFSYNEPNTKLTEMINYQVIPSDDYEYIIDNVNFIFREDKLEIDRILYENIGIINNIKKYCDFNIKQIIKDSIDKIKNIHTSKNIMEHSILIVKYILNYLDETCSINKKIDTSGDRIIKHIMYCKNLDLIKFFITNYDIDLLHCDKSGNNILHNIKYTNDIFYYENFIGLIKELKPEVFNKMIRQQNKKKKYPYIEILINNYPDVTNPKPNYDINFPDLIPNDDIIICNMLIQYVRSKFFYNFRFSKVIIIVLFEKIQNIEIRQKIFIYLFNLIIKFIDNQYDFNIFCEIINQLNQLKKIDTNYFNFINNNYILKNSSNCLINNIDELVLILPIILEFDSINIWEQYNSSNEDLINFFDKVIEINNSDLTSFLITIGQARNPKLIDQLIRTDLIKKKFDFLIKNKDRNGNIIFHHFAIGNIKISNPVDFKYNKELDSVISKQNLSNTNYKYSTFFDLLYQDINLFKITNNSGWRIIDILSVIPRYLDYYDNIDIKPDFSIDKYYKIILDKINNIADILIKYYNNEQITVINENDNILLLFYEKFRILPIINIQNLSRIIIQKTETSKETILQELTKFKINLYKYIPYYLLNAQNKELYSNFDTFMARKFKKEASYSKYTSNHFLDSKYINKLYPKDGNFWFYNDDKIFIESLIHEYQSDYKNKYLKYKQKYLNLLK